MEVKVVTARDLVSAFRMGRIVVDPTLQRIGFHWNSRMVREWAESLMHETTTPIILVKLPNRDRLIVLDGMQRLLATNMLLEDPSRFGVSADAKPRLEAAPIPILIYSLTSEEAVRFFMVINRNMVRLPAAYALFLLDGNEPRIEEVKKRILYPLASKLCDTRCLVDPAKVTVAALAGAANSEVVCRTLRYALGPNMLNKLREAVKGDNTVIETASVIVEAVNMAPNQKILSAIAKSAHIVAALKRVGQDPLAIIGSVIQTDTRRSRKLRDSLKEACRRHVSAGSSTE